MRAAGLGDRVTLLMEDYRDLRGRYDKLVSIEMIEAVGWQYFDRFFARCSELLAPDGLMLLQAIVVEDRLYEVEKAAKSFANTHVFPGGCLPSNAQIADCVARMTDLRAVWMEDITEHYPRTLAAWRERFFAAWDELRSRGYDERFRRLWTFYLSSSEAGFRERRIGDVQILLAKPRVAPGGAPESESGRTGRSGTFRSPSLIAHTRTGEGEPLLLLHGLGATGAIWEPVSGRLAQEREVIAIDLPGFGGSDAAAGRSGADPGQPRRGGLASSARALGSGRPHVAGNSLGAWVGLEMAQGGRGRLGDGALSRPGSGASRWGHAASTAMPSRSACARCSR